MLTLEDAVTLVVERSGRMGRLPAGGAMASVGGASERIEAILKEFGGVDIAGYNSPEQVVLSGEREALAPVLERLRGEGMSVTELRVSHAFHSSRMDPMVEGFEDAIAGLSFRAPDRVLISSVSGQVAGDELTTASYWAQQIRKPVRFTQGMTALLEQGIDAVLELGPEPVLLGLGRRATSSSPPPALWLPSLRRNRDDWAVLLRSVAQLYTHGADIDWNAFDQPFRCERIPLPTYPFDRKRYWLTDALSPTQGSPRALPGSSGRYALSGQPIQIPGRAIHQVLRIGEAHQRYLGDHIVHGHVVIPAAFHVAVVLATAADRFGEGRATLRDVQLLRPLILQGERDLHLRFEPDESGSYTFEIATSAEDGWLVHTTGVLHLDAAAPAETTPIDALRARCTEPFDANRLFDQLAELRIDWGPRWRWLREVAIGPGQTFCALAPTSFESGAEAPLHPALIDNAFGAILPLMPPEMAGSTTPFLPYAIGAVRLFAPAEGAALCHATTRSAALDHAETSVSDVTIFDEAGRPLASIEGLVTKRAPENAFLKLGKSA
ncbi:MAG: polyketide synthase dehydratase domain-containing protein, partial [Polyangiaceae bacterium]|nr:polyketide synthase dehydratase domain-containing protein [Polyangiaceae bacterium]